MIFATVVKSLYFKQDIAKKMSKETDKNLPSITTMVTHSGKRSGDNVEEILLTIKVREMLNITRVRKGQVDKQDLCEVVKTHSCATQGKLQE